MNHDSATTALAKKLIQQPSVTPDDAGCQAILADLLQNDGYRVEHMNFGSVSNLWARIGDERPNLVFVGHTDVVPTGDESEWIYPPFSATEADGVLYGRGAADMKGSIAAMVTACQRFHSRYETFAGSMSLLITSDEEGIAVDGTRRVLEVLDARSEKIDYCLVGEPTSVSELGDTIKIGRRGSLCCELVVKGKQGHVAYPHLADNPIHRSGRLIASLAEMTWHDGGTDFPDTTLQISNINAGVGAGNVIPGRLDLSMNFRYSPATKAATLIDDVESLCRSLNLDYEANWDHSADSYYTSETYFADAVADAVSHILSCKPILSTDGGTSDGRFVAGTGAQVIELGPLNSTIHKVNECVATSDLDLLSQVYERIMETVLLGTDHGTE
ncbi:MAG: succinyl-diaminopimelate desuccinylase [Acidiferrobacterales bacterium]|nr:succinyl-diaminopimelate desuccinylase [Acidiferrobacterales bacterium]